MELYIHIPFCKKKCRYCAFTSYVAQEAYYKEYVDLLVEEARQRVTEAEEPIRTIYIGGGTPSLLPPKLFKKLIAQLGTVFSFADVTEFSAEANPGTVTKKWLETAVESGVNRLSLGMQAYQERLLHTLGRIHQFEDVDCSVNMANDAGINNINLDLMFGVPLQTRADWIETMKAALSFHPTHISAYGLIPEEGTPLFNDLHMRILELPEPDEERLMYDDAISFLQDQEYFQYEISNFSLKGYECQHNIGYWTLIPYIGLGISAASMTHISAGKNGLTYFRRNNPTSISEYSSMVRENPGRCNVEKIKPSDACFENMMLGLRMNCGVNEESFRKKHGRSLESCYGRKLHTLEEKGLLIHENGYWKLTRRGFDIQNSILVELME